MGEQILLSFVARFDIFLRCRVCSACEVTEKSRGNFLSLMNAVELPLCVIITKVSLCTKPCTVF